MLSAVAFTNMALLMEGGLVRRSSEENSSHSFLNDSGFSLTLRRVLHSFSPAVAVDRSTGRLSRAHSIGVTCR